MWTEDATKYAFAAVCVLQAVGGGTLGVLAIEPGARALTPYPFSYKKLSFQNLEDEARHHIEQQSAAIASTTLSRLSQIALFLAVISGLVINFPPLWWLGLALWLVPMGYGMALLITARDAGWRIGVFRATLERNVARGYTPLMTDVREHLHAVLKAPREQVRELEQALVQPARGEEPACSSEGGVAPE